MHVSVAAFRIMLSVLFELSLSLCGPWAVCSSAALGSEAWGGAIFQPARSSLALTNSAALAVGPGTHCGPQGHCKCFPK